MVPLLFLPMSRPPFTARLVRLSAGAEGGRGHPLGFAHYVAGNDLKFQAGHLDSEAKNPVTGGPSQATTSGVRSPMPIQS